MVQGDGIEPSSAIYKIAAVHQTACPSSYSVLSTACWTRTSLVLLVREPVSPRPNAARSTASSRRGENRTHPMPCSRSRWPALSPHADGGSGSWLRSSTTRTKAACPTNWTIPEWSRRSESNALAAGYGPALVPNVVAVAGARIERADLGVWARVRTVLSLRRSRVESNHDARPSHGRRPIRGREPWQSRKESNPRAPRSKRSRRNPPAGPSAPHGGIDPPPAP